MIKRLLLLAGLTAAPLGAHATWGFDSWSASPITSIGLTWTGLQQFNGGIRMLGTGNDIFSASTTIRAITGGGEPRGMNFYGTYSSAENGNLPMGIYALVEYSTSGVTTDHVVSIFGRARTSPWTAGFAAGVEGNAHCSSIISSAYCVGTIGHAVWLGALTSTPTAAIIGHTSRSEIVDPADPTYGTPRIGNIDTDIVAFEAQTYGGYNDRRLNYNFRGFSTYGKIVNMGPLIAFSTSSIAVTAGSTIQAFCGGLTQVTAASPVTTNTTNTFQAPSTSLTTGLGNKDCKTTVVNTGASAITLDAQALFLTRGGVDVYLPSAASVEVMSTGSTWVQASPVSYNALADIYLSSVTAASSLAATTTFGNHGTVTLTPGDWDVSAACQVVANGATVTALDIAVSVNSGNTTSDQVAGTNQIPMFIATAATNSGGSVPPYRVAVAASTPVYVKVRGTFTVATPTAACSISARRR